MATACVIAILASSGAVGDRARRAISTVLVLLKRRKYQSLEQRLAGLRPHEEGDESVCDLTENLEFVGQLETTLEELNSETRNGTIAIQEELENDAKVSIAPGISLAIAVVTAFIILNPSFNVDLCRYWVAKTIWWAMIGLTLMPFLTSWGFVISNDFYIQICDNIKTVERLLDILERKKGVLDAERAIVRARQSSDD